MVFVRDRRSKQRKDPVTGGLDHVSVVAPHRLDHELERRIYERAGFLGVEILLQSRGVDDVDEQCSDKFALPFRQGLRVIGVRWRRWPRGWRLDAIGVIRERERTAALVAESGTRTVWLPAFGAAKRQRDAAGAAELGAVRVLILAGLAPHR